ncbi:MAG: hypothetical protein DMD89_30145 [Candidatus Rokuibacteriota bacterium]|nr:MAG: hypothetical protein DMD89_30145 [Candidatus Rokubacteria bacterium]
MERIIEGNTEFLCWAILGEQQERIDRARAAQPIVQANLRGRLQALRARKNLPEDQLPMAAPLHGLN